jgi:hypothetical protein
VDWDADTYLVVAETGSNYRDNANVLYDKVQSQEAK